MALGRLELCSMQNSASPGVVITGASTGIGRACARLLAAYGYAVLAGVRTDADAQSIAGEAAGVSARGGSLAAVQLDVTDSASITAAAEIVRATFEGKLFALINNAGVVVAGPVEHVALGEWRRQFEINLFGHIAVVQAMLPMLRGYQRVASAAPQARGAPVKAMETSSTVTGALPGAVGALPRATSATTQAMGAPAQVIGTARPRGARIVFVSSIAGRIAQPIVGPYCASKYALEAMADSLRVELRAQQIGVTLIEPGAIDTPIWKKGLGTFDSLPADGPAYAEYGALIRGMAAGAAKAAAGAVPAELVARVVLRAVSSRRAPPRRLVGNDAKLGALAKWLLPSGVLDYVLDTSLRRAARGVGK
jgi:NAD(P)-dependent dehydrogenase (short-subunit alcohol dehydrogenase family)